MYGIKWLPGFVVQTIFCKAQKWTKARISNPQWTWIFQSLFLPLKSQLAKTKSLIFGKVQVFPSLALFTTIWRATSVYCPALVSALWANSIAAFQPNLFPVIQADVSRQGGKKTQNMAWTFNSTSETSRPWENLLWGQEMREEKSIAVCSGACLVDEKGQCGHSSLQLMRNGSTSLNGCKSFLMSPQKVLAKLLLSWKCVFSASNQFFICNEIKEHHLDSGLLFSCLFFSSNPAVFLHISVLSPEA